MRSLIKALGVRLENRGLGQETLRREESWKKAREGEGRNQRPPDFSPG